MIFEPCYVIIHKSFFNDKKAIKKVCWDKKRAEIFVKQMTDELGYWNKWESYEIVEAPFDSIRFCYHEDIEKSYQDEDEKKDAKENYNE